MARVFTVGPNSTYAGILSALSSVSALYTNPDTDGQDWVFECEAFTDITSGNAGIAPTTAGTNNYSIIIRPQVGAHHEGVSGGGYTLYSPFNSYVSLYINAPNTVLEGVQFNVGSAKFLRLRGAGCVFKQCIFNGSSANEIFKEAADNVSFLNCLFKSSVDDVKSSAVFKNCVFDVGTSYAILPNSSQTPLVQNCVFLGHVTGAVDGSVSAGSSNNCSHDSSIGSAVSSTDGVDFVSPSTGDYTPTATGALFKAGTNPLSPLSNPDDWKDITGKTRAYWDIGAFAAPASLAENTHLATFTTRPTDTGASGGPNVAGTETNYPGYIDLSEAPQALWDAVTSGGGDIRVFENQAGGLVELPAEVVSCDTSAETGELHYLLPSISASTPQEIRLYADGVSSRYDHADPFGRNAVWGDYERVYHLGTLSDSTGNANLTAIGTATVGGTVGPLGDAATLDGNSDYFTATPYDFGTGDFTAQAWAKTSDTARNDILVQGNTNGDWHGVYTNSSGYLAGAIDDGANAVFEESSIGTRIDDDAWHKVDIASDRSASMELYVDGDPDKSSASISAVGDVYTTGDLMIGARIGAGGLVTANLWDGAIAEVRLRTGALSANWITTEYNNQSDPSSFYTATDPNAGGGATVDTASLLAQAAAVTGTFTIEGAAGTVTVTFADLQAQSATTPASTATREITSSAALSATDIEFLNYAAREVTSASTLAAQSAAVSGSSDPMRTSEGVLTAQEADLAGTASRTVVAVGSVQAQDSGVASTVGQNQNVTGTGVLTTFPVSLMAAVAINGEVPVTGSLATTQIATSRQH
jgi:hypothetical protein